MSRAGRARDGGPTEAARHLAKTAAATFGGVPSVRSYHDEDGSHAVHVLSCKDAPVDGYTAHSTVDLHETPNMLEGEDVRVELAGVAGSEETEFPNLLATAAFFVMKDRWLAAPGVVFPGILGYYELSETLEHVMWAEPFAFEGLGSVPAAPGPTAHWLIAVPLAESERRFLLGEGYDALEQLFDERDVPYYDLRRRPVV